MEGCIMKDYTKNKTPNMLEPFFPNEMLRYIIVGCFLVILELLGVLFFPLPCTIFQKPDHIPWYLFPLYKGKHMIQNDVLFISFLTVFALVFVLWPFITSIKKRG